MWNDLKCNLHLSYPKNIQSFSLNCCFQLWYSKFLIYIFISVKCIARMLRIFYNLADDIGFIFIVLYRPLFCKAIQSDHYFQLHSWKSKEILHTLLSKWQRFTLMQCLIEIHSILSKDLRNERSIVLKINT